jgi:hypothetical protein
MTLFGWTFEQWTKVIGWARLVGQPVPENTRDAFVRWVSAACPGGNYADLSEAVELRELWVRRRIDQPLDVVIEVFR